MVALFKIVLKFISIALRGFENLFNSRFFIHRWATDPPSNNGTLPQKELSTAPILMETKRNIGFGLNSCLVKKIPNFLQPFSKNYK